MFVVARAGLVFDKKIAELPNYCNYVKHVLLEFLQAFLRVLIFYNEE